jgi:hypothetical protein
MIRDGMRLPAKRQKAGNSGILTVFESLRIAAK